jgi:phosphoglycolate phosphatase
MESYIKTLKEVAMINTILFDLDGTLTDSKTGIVKSAQYALESFGIKVDNLDDLTSFIGPPIRQSFKELYDFDDNNVEKAVVKFRERYFTIGVYENEMYKGIDVLLHKLKDKGKTLFVATSKVTALANTVLSHFNIDKYFTFVSGSEMNGDRSEKSEVIKYALVQNNITDLSSCIMIGDRKHDIVGAKAVGMKSIGVLYGYGGFNELSIAGADYIVKDVNKLSELLLNF